MAVTFEEYSVAIRSSILEPLVKLEFLTDDERFDFEVRGKLMEGSLRGQKVNGVRRTLDLTLSNITNDFLVNEDNLWVRRKFRLFLGLVINGQEVFYPKGVFVLTVPEISSTFTNTTLRISAIDKWSLLDGTNGGYLIDPLIFDNGSVVKEIIDTILTEANDPKDVNFLGSGQQITYNLIREYGDVTYADILLELARFLSYEIYYDVDGRLTLHELSDPKIMDAAWEYTTQDRIYLGSNRRFDFPNVYNIVRVIGANINGDIAIGTARNEDPTSPVSIQAIGEKYAPPIIDDIYETDEEAQGYAEYNLQEKTALQETVTVSSLKLYHLLEGDVITFVDEQGQFEPGVKYEIRGFTLGLMPNDLMSLEVWRTRTIS